MSKVPQIGSAEAERQEPQCTAIAGDIQNPVGVNEGGKVGKPDKQQQNATSALPKAFSLGRRSTASEWKS